MSVLADLQVKAAGQMFSATSGFVADSEPDVTPMLTAERGFDLGAKVGAPAPIV